MEFDSWPGAILAIILFAAGVLLIFGIFGLFMASVFMPGPFLFHRARRNRAWERTAERLGGRFRPGGVFSLPTITFEHRGEIVAVDTLAIKTKFTHCYPRLVLAWPDHRLVVRISHRGILTPLTRWLGQPEIAIGSAKFQSTIAVFGNDPARIEGLLCPDVMAKLNLFRTLTFRGTWNTQPGLSADLSRGQLVLMKWGLLNTEEDLENFIRAGLSLYDALRDSNHQIAEMAKSSNG